MADEYLTTVYKALCQDKPLREILKEVRRIKTLNLRVGLPYSPKMEQYATHLAKECKRKKPTAIVGLAIADWVAKEFQRQEAFEDTSKIANEFTREQEAKDKKAIIDGALKELGEEGERKGDDEGKALDLPIFFLCSSHDDCAQDHQDYQGELYYDRFWRRYVKDETARRIVEGLISSRGLKSLQWVINRPIWLMTRPNCRHYFAQCTILEVMRNDATTLVYAKGLHRKIGKRDSGQTIRHPLNQSWYTEANIKAIIGKYKERLALHEGMLKASPCDTLKGYVMKDRKLIQKWEYMLKATRRR